MGMDLVGAGGCFGWSNAGWADLLALAEEFGWEPMGTGPPRGRRLADWTSGFYFGNDGQRVYARDARALAGALERALAELARGESRRPTRKARTTDYAEAKLRGSGRPRRGRLPTREIGRQERADLRKFITFCRQGSFRIF